MPIYEYECTACWHEWEELQKITDAPCQVCPECRNVDARRLISARTNFVLKGDGWARDLYSTPKR